MSVKHSPTVDAIYRQDKSASDISHLRYDGEPMQWGGMELTDRFKANAKAALEKSGLPLTRVAARGGVKISTARSAIYGESSPTLKTALGVANGLEVELADLLGMNIPSLDVDTLGFIIGYYQQAAIQALVEMPAKQRTPETLAVFSEGIGRAVARTYRAAAQRGYSLDRRPELEALMALEADRLRSSGS